VKSATTKRFEFFFVKYQSQMSQSNSNYNQKEASRWNDQGASKHLNFGQIQTSNFEPFEQLDLFSPFLNPQQQFKRFQDQQEQVSLSIINS
jgi:hypothetical protein